MGLSIDEMSGQRQEVDDFSKKIELLKKSTNGEEITLESLKEIGFSSSDIEKLIKKEILEKGDYMEDETIFTLKGENIPKAAEDDLNKDDLNIYHEAA